MAPGRNLCSTPDYQLDSFGAANRGTRRSPTTTVLGQAGNPVGCVRSEFPRPSAKATGVLIVQTSPVGTNSIRAPKPRSCAKLRSISRVPKPRRVGGATGGPPLPVQHSFRFSVDCRSTLQVSATVPEAFDRALCLTALVANSCSAIARSSAIRGETRRLGPRT